MLAAKFGLPAVSTGALLRQQRAEGTPLGREADAWTAQGRFFPDEIAMRVVGRWIAGRDVDAFLLDGFPRTLGQAVAFDAQLAGLGSNVEAVFHLALGDEAIRARVSARVTCGGCGLSFSAMRDGVGPGDVCPDCGGPLGRREDDTLEALEERLEQHRLLTGPAIQFYRDEGRLTEIDAGNSREVIFQKLCEIVEEAVPA